MADNKNANYQHAIKNIGQEGLNMNEIRFNNRLGSLVGRFFELLYIFCGKTLSAKLICLTLDSN